MKQAEQQENVAVYKAELELHGCTLADEMSPGRTMVFVWPKAASLQHLVLASMVSSAHHGGSDTQPQVYHSLLPWAEQRNALVTPFNN
eukprot:scaffold11239_cov20-Tisochrysis_lutea.AAC.2